MCPYFRLKNLAVNVEEMLNFLQISEVAGGGCRENKEMNQVAINARNIELVVMWVQGEDSIEG